MGYDIDFYEATNEHGHKQAYQHDPERGDFPVCSESNCRASGYVNLGSGTACHQCRDRFDLECEADFPEFYHDGLEQRHDEPYIPEQDN